MKRLKSISRHIKKHKILWGIGVGIVLIIAFIFRPKAPTAISTQKITRTHLVQSVSISGKVAAKKVADLSFLTGGTLAYLGVKQGDTVSQYQTIATLDQRTTQTNLQSALIDYSKQRNTFDQTQDNNQNRTPQQALSDAMKRILQNNQYDLDKAINSVDLQELAKEQSVLMTPIAGIVTRVDVKSAGVTVAPTTVFEITDPTALVFDMDVDEADIGRIQNGQQAKITLDPFPDQTTTQPVNQIDFVSHTTSTGSNVYTVETLLNDTSGKLRVGMNGNAEITTAQKSNVITVPIAAIINDTYVYVKHDNKNFFSKRHINLGLQNDTEAEVTSGLQVGEAVALEPTRVEQEKLVK